MSEIVGSARELVKLCEPWLEPSKLPVPAGLLTDDGISATEDGDKASADSVEADIMGFVRSFHAFLKNLFETSDENKNKRKRANSNPEAARVLK